ncbi:hypothetical protein [Sulfurimonas sp.]|uniref:hypothetical protein n=1 Tax=Sulfurimonas sp. TaxID=2022749 RepID=UPI003D0E6529
MQNLQGYKPKVPQEVLETIEYIANGNLRNIKMNYNNGNFEFHADSYDGQKKFIIKKQHIPGIISESKMLVQNPNSLNERRERVLHFHKEGLSQTKISELTMTSQKTVSNDLKFLRDQGKIK